MNGNSLPLVDVTILATLRDAIGDDVADIINLYLDEAPNSFKQMFQALSQLDFVTVGRLAHSLKSSSANLGAMQTSSLASKLEVCIQSGLTDSNQIKEIITNLQENFDQSSPLFRSYLK